MKRIGIYGRKSVFSDKSESIEHQFTLGKEYAYANYDNLEIIYYKDEGESGSYLERPDFQILLNDVINDNLDIVICYKLDRISRDVADFGAVYKLFMAHNTEIIPLRDNIVINENMSPIEKAMMYINTVFSQVERENTVIRVTDNMIELAKDGYWTGGRAPLGFTSQEIIVGGKKHHILCHNPVEIEFYTMITDTFLRGFSLSGLETYFRHNNIKTLNNAYLSSTQIWTILKSPFAAPADEATYDYFLSLGCNMAHDRSKFDGSHGLLVYGRTSGGRNKKHITNPPDKWLVSVGLHTPIITSDKWLSIQKCFGNNTFCKTRKYKVGFLNDILRCSCGYYMKTKHKFDKKYNVHYYHYRCLQRERKGSEYCASQMIPVETLDNEVIEILKGIKLDKTLIDNYTTPASFFPLFRKPETINGEIENEEKKIENLTMSLAESSGSTAAKYIIKDIESHDKRIDELKDELKKSRLAMQNVKELQINKEDKYNAVCKIVDCIETATYDEINALLKETLTECVYDGEVLHIKL